MERSRHHDGFCAIIIRRIAERHDLAVHVNREAGPVDDYENVSELAIRGARGRGGGGRHGEIVAHDHLNVVVDRVDVNEDVVGELVVAEFEDAAHRGRPEPHRDARRAADLDGAQVDVAVHAVDHDALPDRARCAVHQRRVHAADLIVQDARIEAELVREPGADISARRTDRRTEMIVIPVIPERARCRARRT